ncbi:hypothetical protein NQ315_008532 [Exocentrus adspersus]|uniref:Uncharacterized protein n=1 Tax=Exocentrus adspersus TaxID=1586481 RepID=A0AAV8W6C4_9CUCU|nr:hypothetical protein NQ315_008532 [Exocentrus adspersus]
MFGIDLCLFIFMCWISGSQAFYQNHHRIMTPINVQTGNPLPTPGNLNAMFPSPVNNNPIPINNEGTTSAVPNFNAMFPSAANNTVEEETTPSSNEDTNRAMESTSAAPTSTDGVVSPDVTTETSVVTEVVVPEGGTVIRIEFPSTINVFVNITSPGFLNPSVGVSNPGGGVVDVPTVDNAIDTLAVDSSVTTRTSVEVSTVTPADTETTVVIPTEISTVEVSTVESTSEDSPTVPGTISTINVPVTETTVEPSTMESTSTLEISTTVDSTMEIPDATSTVEASVTEESSTLESTNENVPTTVPVSTVDVSVTQTTVEISETPTIEIGVEIITTNSTVVESSTLTASNDLESTTEAMRQIQININLSDNTMNSNFGSTSTTQATVENLGQLQSKNIHKEKCEEYYSKRKTAKDTKVQIFIVGGTNSKPKEFPHMAALGYGTGPKKDWLCGGSLISENFVVTAAHCVTSKSLGDVQVVRLGTTLLNTETLDSEDFKVIKRITHPLHNVNDQYNDIALLQLDHPVTFSEYIFPICLYSSNLTNEVLVATGWGKTNPSGDVSHELQKVELEYFPNKENDTCTIKALNEEGICISINYCPYAQNLLKNGVRPQICGFIGNNSLVCCNTIEPPKNVTGVKPFKELPKQKVPDAMPECKEYYPYLHYFLLVGAAKPSLAKQFPHMAVIGFGDKNNTQWLCGASLISYNFVLTAAHCLNSAEFGLPKYVRIGDLDLATDTDEAGPQDFNVKNVFPHPEYKKPARYNDIGLIELDRNVTLTQFVSIACLDTKRNHTEKQMTATGWGRTEFLGDSSSFLLKAQFDIAPNDACRPFYEKDEENLPMGVIDDLQICAGGVKEQDTCQGDSGGPLQVLSARSSSIIVYDIVAVTSIGKPCGLTKAPSLYTRVYSYLEWIEDIVWPSSYAIPRIRSYTAIVEPALRGCSHYHPSYSYPGIGISGGLTALPTEYPHMAVIGYETEEGIEWKCGGSLISKKFVLTAAHCTNDKGYVED